MLVFQHPVNPLINWSQCEIAWSIVYPGSVCIFISCNNASIPSLERVLASVHQCWREEKCLKHLSIPESLYILCRVLCGSMKRDEPHVSICLHSGSNMCCDFGEEFCTTWRWYICVLGCHFWRIYLIGLALAIDSIWCCDASKKWSLYWSKMHSEEIEWIADIELVGACMWE